MKVVTLFRHAKSGDKDNPSIGDFDRGLSDRGRKSAAKIGAALRDRGLRPNLVACSPSARTRQTLTIAAAEAWDNPPRIRFDRALYEAEAATLLAFLHALPEDVTHVMIVGHNPGLQELALALAPKGSEAQEQFEGKLPTAAVASFDFDADLWKNLEPGTAELRLYLSPNSLGSGRDK